MRKELFEKIALILFKITKIKSNVYKNFKIGIEKSA